MTNPRDDAANGRKPVAALDKVKALPWWVLILIGLFGVPVVLRMVRRAV